MELIYSLSKEVQYDQLADELVSLGYDKLPDNEFGLEYDDNKYLVLKFIEEDDLIRAIVRVYNNPDRDRWKYSMSLIYLVREGDPGRVEVGRRDFLGQLQHY